MARKVVCVFVSLLAVFLVGTVVVLSSAVAFFGVDTVDVITEAEMRRFEASALLTFGPAGSPPRVIPSAASFLGEEEQNDTVPVADGGPDDLYEGVDEEASPDDGIWDDLAALEERGTEQGAEEEEQDLGARIQTPQELRKRHSDPLDEERAVVLPQLVPRIVHQTWKTNVLPPRWEKVRESCRALHPDYEYMLWTDESSRDFIANEYSWFLPTFDGYRYPIQRADAIRYFVLHFYGGIYMDLDVGCLRSMDPLLFVPVLLPATIPVGVSNDVMIAQRGHPFLDLVIHKLRSFDHQYGTNYPTVMFSTGPMFLSAQYGLWPNREDNEKGRQVRILPKRWYGKNAKPEEMGESFFVHFYGSSWHADDAGFVTFLGRFGILLMYAGFAVVVLGVLHSIWPRRFKSINSHLSHRKFDRPSLPLHQHTPTSESFIDTPTSSRPGSPLLEPRGGLLHNLLSYLPSWLYNSEPNRIPLYSPVPRLTLNDKSIRPDHVSDADWLRLQSYYAVDSPGVSSSFPSLSPTMHPIPDSSLTPMNPELPSLPSRDWATGFFRPFQVHSFPDLSTPNSASTTSSFSYDSCPQSATILPPYSPATFTSTAASSNPFQQFSTPSSLAFPFETSITVIPSIHDNEQSTSRSSSPSSSSISTCRSFVPPASIRIGRPPTERRRSGPRVLGIVPPSTQNSNSSPSLPTP